MTIKKLVVVAALLVLATVAHADALWPGDCRVKVQGLDGETEWFAFRGVKSCEAGEHRGEVRIVFLDGRQITQWLGGNVIELVFKPMPKQGRE